MIYCTNIFRKYTYTRVTLVTEGLVYVGRMLEGDHLFEFRHILKAIMIDKRALHAALIVTIVQYRYVKTARDRKGPLITHHTVITTPEAALTLGQSAP